MLGNVWEWVSGGTDKEVIRNKDPHPAISWRFLPVREFSGAEDL
jgi:hypothetical protein